MIVIYIYGFQVIVSTIIVTIALFILGLLFNEIKLTVVFMAVFMLLRTYSGGFHCYKFKHCLLISSSILIVELFLKKITSYELKMSICMIFSIAPLIIICKLAPVENENNPLSNSDKIKYGKITKVITVMIFLVIVFGTVMVKGLIDYFFIMSLTLIAVAILLVIPLLSIAFK